MDPVAHMGRVGEDDRFIPDSPRAFKLAFRPFRGKEVWVTIEERRKTRSTAQNKAWWALVIKPFADYMGERDKNFVHHQVLVEIGHYDLVTVLGKEVKKVKPTHNLDSKAFSELFESAQELGAAFGVMIPDPSSTQAKAMGA